MSRKVNWTTTLYSYNCRRRRKFWEFTVSDQFWCTFPAIGEWPNPLTMSRKGNRTTTARRRRKIWEFTVSDQFWCTFPAIVEWPNPLTMSRKVNRTTTARGRRRRKFWEFTVSDQFWCTFPAIENVEESKPNYKLAAGKIFENLLFLINFGVPFQQSENGRTLLQCVIKDAMWWYASLLL